MSTSKPPKTAPSAIATWNVATISPPALSAWSGAARTSQLCSPTGTAPKAKPQTATAAAATVGEAPKEIFNDPKRPDPTKPEGIAASKLNAEQQATLVKIIKLYLFRCRTDVAAEEFAKIEKAGIGNVFFAWAGGFELGQPHYYRVQNTAFVLEYDNTQNNANHVHCIWRDFANDFGGDLLKRHASEGHAK